MTACSYARIRVFDCGPCGSATSDFRHLPKTGNRNAELHAAMAFEDYFGSTLPVFFESNQWSESFVTEKGFQLISIMHCKAARFCLTNTMGHASDGSGLDVAMLLLCCCLDKTRNQAEDLIGECIIKRLDDRAAKTPMFMLSNRFFHVKITCRCGSRNKTAPKL